MEITIRRCPYRGWKIIRDGKDVVTSQVFYSREEVEEYAKVYSARWGDRFVGFVD